VTPRRRFVNLRRRGGAGKPFGKELWFLDKTLLKGLSVLEAVVNLQGEALTIDALAEQLGLTRSNTHRTLQTLVHAGYIERDPQQGGYRGTVKLFELGSRSLRKLDVRKLAQPFMEQLLRETSETVHLSVLDGLEVVYVEKLDGIMPIRAYTSLGSRAPAYAVATGKALLSVQPETYLDLFKDRIQRYTKLTISDIEGLKRDSRKALAQGYAVNRGEWREGVGGVASAVFDGAGSPVAALGISGPMERLGPGKIKDYGPLVRKTAAALSAAMGFRGQAPGL
jgi:DNA-binding IclR family transcriptional regulator